MASETEKPVQCTCGCKCRKVAAAILLVLIAGIACWYIHHPNRPRSPIDPKPGTICTIQFRRDALGGAGSPVPPTVDNVNGADVSMKKVVLIATSHEAILVEYYGDDYRNPGRLYWIPKSSILSIAYDSPTTE